MEIFIVFHFNLLMSLGYFHEITRILETFREEFVSS